MKETKFNYTAKDGCLLKKKFPINSIRFEKDKLTWQSTQLIDEGCCKSIHKGEWMFLHIAMQRKKIEHE